MKIIRTQLFVTKIIIWLFFAVCVNSYATPSGDPYFWSTHFAGAGNCTHCHNGLYNDSGEDVSIEKDWSSSMMANSSRDPFWRAKLRSELNRNPKLENVLNDTCTKCHAPMANFEAKHKGEEIKVFEDGILNPDNPYYDAAIEGISCTLCHQIEDSPNLGTPESFSAGYTINADRKIYGPYDNLFPFPMTRNTDYQPVYSPHSQESEMCATCHNLKTPYVDENGGVLSTSVENEFPEQMTYSEWEHSDFASTRGKQSCQSCHMARTDGTPISRRPPWLARRDNFAIHDFVGANKMMLDILDKNREELGVRSNNFSETIDKTEKMLAGAASITVLSSSLRDGTLETKLRIHSNTGHKLPSAYPSRRIILQLSIYDAKGRAVFESGTINKDGSIVGVDADDEKNRYEPHYDVIESTDQVQVYESIMGNNLGEVTYTLLRGKEYLKDNRLLPKGFDKLTAHDDIKVAGLADKDENFRGGMDDITYRVSKLTGGRYTVKVKLVYQAIAYAFVQDLFEDSDPIVQDFNRMYSNSEHKSVVMEELSFSVKK